jgi:integrase
MGVKLREKQLSNGQISFYLDIYHNKARWYEFLEIHINKNRPSNDDREKRRLVQEIRAKREHELIVEDNGLNDRKKKLACFVVFFEEFIKEKNNDLYKGAFKRLKKFAGNQPVPFVRLNTVWMKDFEKYLLKHVSNNTALNYLTALNAGLNEAVRQKILQKNPWHDLPPHQRLKKQDIYRTAFTIDQLQMLANTSCNIDKQVKQAYFFSCFTGLRWSDVNPLRWDEIIIKKTEGEENYYLHFEQEKTEGIGYLPLSGNAIDIIKERKAEVLFEEKSPYVFPRIKETEGIYRKIYQRVSKALKEWARAAGINEKKLHFHTGRHSFATNVLESSAEGDLYTVSKLLGHRDIKSTQIYAKVRDKRKQAAVKALPKIDFTHTNLTV